MLLVRQPPPKGRGAYVEHTKRPRGWSARAHNQLGF
jgi:hypothetical protein